MSKQKSHVSPSKDKPANPSTSAQFSLINRAQHDHGGGTLGIGDETHIDIFGDDDEWGVGWFGDCWWSQTLTLNFAHGVCRTINATTKRRLGLKRMVNSGVEQLLTILYTQNKPRTSMTMRCIYW